MVFSPAGVGEGRPKTLRNDTPTVCAVPFSPDESLLVSEYCRQAPGPLHPVLLVLQTEWWIISRLHEVTDNNFSGYQLSFTS